MPTERPTKKPTKPLLPEEEEEEEERRLHPRPTKAKPTAIIRRPTERPTKKPTKPLLPEVEEAEEEEERPTPRPTKAKPTTIKRRPTERPTKKPTKPLLPEGEGEERATPRPTRKPTKKIIPPTNNTMKTKPTTGKDYVVSIKVPRFKNELVTADGVTTWIKNVFKGYHCFQSATFVKSRRLPFTNKRALTLELKFACTGRHLGRLVKAVGGVNIIAISCDTSIVTILSNILECHQTGLCLKTMENISTCQIPICTVPCYFIPMTYTAVYQPVLQHPLLKWQRRYRGSSLYTGLQHYWGSQPLTAYGNMRHTGPQGYIPYGHNTGFQHTGAQGYYPYGQNTGLRHPGPQGHLPYSPIAGLRHTGPQGHAKYGHNTGLRYTGIQGYIPYSHTGLQHTGHQAVTSLGHQKKYLTYLTYHPVTYRVTYDSLNIPLKFNDMNNNPAYGISQPYTRHLPQAVSSKQYSPGKAIKPKQAVKKHYIYRNKHRSIY
ncbi:predicted protein [Nematostella vectensis]|uniref:Uncharacterized protein n=1 Tax=Nematostella vectensis TaxID=45351 RepID=A7S998_NEMVE|nr:predicted protein [Nematostella vectensis]|eukprot:XP_001631781.1 predicted protein [Nematostella vectensis]